MKKKSPAQLFCPCGSNREYSDCCAPVLADHRRALTAEMLMRSRYTAFVKKHTAHLLRTWTEKNRPATLNLDGPPVTWIGLVIHKTIDGRAADNTGKVHFTSTYIESGHLCSLNETSNFTRKDGLWYYEDGLCEVVKKKIERNRPCPCGSEKKFKRCCFLQYPPPALKPSFSL